MHAFAERGALARLQVNRLSPTCGDVPRQLAEGHFRLWALCILWIIFYEHAVEAVVASRSQRRETIRRANGV